MKVKPFNDFNEKDSKPLLEESLPEKNNVYDISVLNGFTKNYNEFSNNIQKAEQFIEQFETIANDLSSLVTKDEFETVLATHIIHINESIDHLKNYISGINRKDLTRIDEDLKSVTRKVTDVLELVNENFHKNNKVLFENSLAQEKKISEIKSIVDKVDEDFVVEKLSELNDKVIDVVAFVEETIPNQSKKLNQITINYDSKIKNLSDSQTSLIEKINTSSDQLSHKVSFLEEKLSLKEKESTKLNKKIVESETSLLEKVDSLSASLSESIEIKNKELLNLVSNLETNLENTTKNLSTLNEDIPNQKAKVVNIEVDVNKLQREVKQLKGDKRVNQISEKVVDVEKDLHTINSLIETHNHKFKSIDNEIKETVLVLKKLSNDEKYVTVTKKIEYIEEVLNKFNEKTILTEEIYPNPAQKTSDPLTPLNQNFVTFEQLQKHYQLFINRIQTQLSTLGGGGSSKLWDLDDTDYNTVKNPNDGDVLQYVSANARWEATVFSSGASFDQNLNTTNNVTFANLTTTGDVVITGNLSVLGNSTIFNTSTIVAEDKNILLANGAASAAVADGAGITVDGAQANIIYISSVDKWSFNKPIEVSGNSVLTSANTTTDLGEGNNLYYTEDRANTAIDNKVTKSFVDGLGIDAATLDGIDSSAFALDSDLTTANVVENTNLYFTYDRARAALVGNTVTVGSLISAGNLIVNANVIVDESITANGTITSPFFYSESDATLKEEIEPISNALEKVLNLFGVSFKWKSNQTKSIGVIAQDVEKVVPEIVSTNMGKKTVSYDAIIPLLIEAIKDQQEQINDLKSQLNEKH